MAELIYPELSYSILDSAFNVYNQMGYDHKEKYFHRALAMDFDKKTINYEREKQVAVYFDGKYIGEYYLDFVAENKIIVEVKVKPYMDLGRAPVRQVLNYLNALNLKLAIIIFFTRDGVKFRRVINIANCTNLH